MLLEPSSTKKMILVPKGGEGEVVALEDRSSDQKLFNAKNHNSDKSNNEHTANCRQSSHEIRQQKQTPGILS